MRDHHRRSLLLVLAGLCFAGYALPLFAPPSPSVVAGTAGTHGLLERVFPGVPPLYVVLRLVALAAAVGFAVAALPRQTPLRWPRRDRAAPEPGRGARTLAVALATTQALLALRVQALGRAGQALYFLLFLAPAAVLWLDARRRSQPGAGVRGDPGALLPVAAVLALWLVTRLPDLVSPLRAADPVDTWLSHEWLETASSDGRNLLTQGFLPGLTCIYMFLQGVSLLGPGRLAPSFAWLQAVHVAWCLVAALCVGSLAARLVSRAAAPVAAAAFLFAPFLLLQPLVPAPYVFGPLFTSGLALLAISVHRHRSASAVAALGALAGVAATSHPPLVPAAGLACAAACLSLLRAPRLPAACYAIPLLSLFAAALPALPDAETLRAMSEEFTRARGDWAGLEAVLLGQRDPYAVPELWKAGRVSRIDIAAGALLAPFAIPRTSLRALGDALFDPVGAGLAALGIALALRALRREPAARAVLLVLALGIAPAFASSYDRPSHTRLFVAQVPLAVLAALGFEALRRTLAPGVQPLRAAAAATAAVALGGALLFDVVNPRILAASSIGITARALRGATPPGDAALLVFPGPDDLSWLHEERILRSVADSPVKVVPFEGGASLFSRAAPGAPAAEILFFSPGLEARLHVIESACTRWPRAALYELRDAAGLSRAFAVRPSGPGFIPALPAPRWRVVPCSERRELRPPA